MKICFQYISFGFLQHIPFHVGENSKQPFGVCFLPYFKYSNIIHSFNSYCNTISQWFLSHIHFYLNVRIFFVCKIVRNLCIEILDLQVIVDIGHIGAVLKGLPVRGFCFVILALRTQDVSQVAVSCSAKQNKLDICRSVSRHIKEYRLFVHQHDRR